MFLAMTNKAKRLLYLGYIQQVCTDDLKRGLKELPALLADLPSGFHLLVDLARLESMEPACSTQIGKVMELCDQHGVELVVRVIPEPAKDIGFNMLSIFHYPHHPRAVTCKTMNEAARLLSI
jgi:hypothetical protein